MRRRFIWIETDEWNLGLVVCSFCRSIWTFRGLNESIPLRTIQEIRNCLSCRQCHAAMF